MTYRPAKCTELQELVFKLSELSCYQDYYPHELGEISYPELCRTCDVKALALVAAFLQPRLVEDAGGPPLPLEEPEFEELPF